MSLKTVSLILFAAVVAAGSVLFVVFVSPLQLRPLVIEIERSETAPLSARAVISSREPVRVELRIAAREGEDLRTSYDDYQREHEIPVLGLYPDHANEIEFTTIDEHGNRRTYRREVETDPLPDLYPQIRVETSKPARVGEGMVLLHLAAYDEEGDYHPLASVVDTYGRVRWLYTEDYGHLLHPLENGNLMVQKEDRITEITPLGERTGRSWELEEGLHHDAQELPNGNFLALTTAVGSFEDGVVEIDRDSGDVVRSLDFREILDPDRPRQPINLDDADWLHLNGLDYDPTDDAVVVSGRDQSAVVKVDLDSGEPEWILGNHTHWREAFEPYLLEPVGASSDGETFEWPWGQHAPELYRASGSEGAQERRRLLIYDNGNHRSYEDPLPPGENYSRAVEYEVDESAGTIREIWQYGTERGSELFTPFIGDADYLDNGNRLVVFGGIARDLEGRAESLFDLDAMEVNDMKISARVIEVTADQPAEPVLELAFEDDDSETYAGYRVYQAEKIRFYPFEAR
ncbi:MAG: aryl-sulfate sulfotransferase [Spirochaetota bacterium]